MVYPTIASASDLWSLRDYYKAKAGNNWPVIAPPDIYFNETSLLLTGEGVDGSQNNTFQDSGLNNSSISRIGNVTQGSFSPYAVPMPYSAGTHGGSAYFDGVDDHLSVASSGLPIGGQQYTLEAWIYMPTTSPRGHIFAYGEETTRKANALRINNTGNGFLHYWWASDLDTGNVGITTNTWIHVAATYDGQVRRIFVNGVLSAQDTPAVSLLTKVDNLKLGKRAVANSEYFSGYISDARITNAALYTSNFTPPTEPLISGVNTSFLSRFTNAGIVDSTGKNNIETVGDAQINTSAVKYGTGSIRFDGNDYLVLPHSSELTLNSSDWTIEGWVNFSSGNDWSIFTKTSTVGSVTGLVLKGDSNRWVLQTAGVNHFVISWTPTVGQWYHFAAVRNGNSATMYIDGNAIGSGTLNNTSDSGGRVYIGWNASQDEYLNGYLDDFRVTKGVARYTQNFTPPTSSLSVR